ncbi:hypothetical protein LOTGIDRAFT_170709 [Lottia gigantea]|uniref:Uncharacterized protein n=1 Tax=Lottia gigantea TaxID=225164 RepID=V4AJV0_LOTGI|nr:hypothetical protein LOTGIDRAFT_170709 [Lottia gigantea]ESP04464.1 hypothetical protein LOTGIDRAFT_170709 [Lottia gigantea]
MAYQLRLGDRKYSRRFHTNSVYLNVDFTQNWNNVLPAEVPQQLDNTFNQIIRDIGNYLSCDPDDQVRFSVSHPGLKSPAWIPFNKWSGIRAQDILNPVARILQSNEQFRLDERMTLHVCHVSVPKGDGQGRYLLKRESLSLEDYLKRKKAIVVVKNKDNLCFQRAIVIAKHYANKNDTPEWETQRKRLTKSSGPYSWQTKCTERLIEQVGARPEACQGHETWELYQQTLGQQGYQLFVYSRLLFGKLLYKGKVSDTSLIDANISYHVEHLNHYRQLKDKLLTGGYQEAKNFHIEKFEELSKKPKNLTFGENLTHNEGLLKKLKAHLHDIEIPMTEPYDQINWG